MARDFTSPRTSTVTAANASIQVYTVTITVSPSSGTLVNRYRLFSPVTLEHLFTTDRALRRTPIDFDSDGRTDYGVYDAVQGLWQLRLSAEGDVTVILGAPGTVPIGGVWH